MREYDIKRIAEYLKNKKKKLKIMIDINLCYINFIIFFFAEDEENYWFRKFLQEVIDFFFLI